jgi:hypothetical protein
VTRWHPYYLAFWEEALKYRRNSPENGSAATTILRFPASYVLNLIGVSGEPVSPGTDFQELEGARTDPSFLTGSVQPITLRAVVTMLLNSLPPAELQEVGMLLPSAVSDEFAVPGDNENRSLQRMFPKEDLERFASPVLDSCPEVPLFFVHLGASQRSIVRDMEDQVRHSKAKRDLPSSKVHSASLDDYLKVWDLREG